MFKVKPDLVGLAEAQGIDIIGSSANGDNWFHHDMVVKKINGRQTMLVDYWDSGYVTLDVDDPAKPLVTCSEPIASALVLPSSRVRMAA